MTTMRLPLRRGLAAVAVACALAVAGCGPKNDPAALVESAKASLAKADVATATIQLKNALQQAPDHAEARFLLARALLQSGDAAGAETELRKAIDLHYPAEKAYPVMARALLARGEYQKTIALSDRQLEDPKARADVGSSVALAYLNVGNVEAARKAADAAGRDDPNDARVLLTRAQVAAASNDVADSTRYVDAALASDPNDSDAIVFKAQVLLAQDQRDAAQKFLQDAVAAHPDAVAPRFALVTMLISARRVDDAAPHVAALHAKSPNDVRTTYAEALLAYAKNDPGRARDLVQRVLAGHPDHLPSLMLSGLAQYQVGSYAAAEDAFTRVMNKAPNEPNARHGLAATYLRTGRPRQALELVEPILRNNSQDPAVWRTGGEAALAMGNLQLASRYFERAGNLDGKNLGTQVRLAQVRMATGDAARAFTDLEALSAGDKSQYEADLAIIAGHMRRREMDAARDAANKLVAKQPDNPISHAVMGSVHLARRDLAAARASFDKALALDPKYYPAAYNLAMLDVREGKPEAARARYDALIAKDPTNEELLLSQADLATMTGGSTEDASKLVDRAVAAHPQSVRARLAQIALAARKTDKKAALAAAEAARAALPQDPQIAEAVALAQMASGNPNQAVEVLRQASAAQPQNAAPLLRLAEDQASTRDLPGAIVSTRKALALQPTSAQGWAELAKLLLASGQPEQAVAEARKLEKEYPDKALGYAFEGEVWALQKKYDEAAQAYRQALAKDPLPVIAGRLYFMLYNAGKANDANAFADQWNREHPKDAALRIQAGQLAQLRNDNKAAVAYYKAALEIEPDNVVVLNNLAWLLNEAKDPAARELGERAYRAAPFNPNVMDTLGWILVGTSDAARGAQLLRMASNLAPADAQIRLHLGAAQAKTGDKAGARATLEPFTRLDAGSPLRTEAEKTLSSL